MVDLETKPAIWDDSGDHEDNEEPWLVSYADMVTLMFGFFVILFSFSTIDDKKFKELGKDVAATFSGEFEKKSAISGENIDETARQLKAFQALISMINLGDNIADAVSKIEAAEADSQAGESVGKIAQDRLSAKVEIDDSTLKIKRRDEQHFELILPNITLFSTGSDVLMPEAIEDLKDLAANLSIMQNLVNIEIVGHTDSVPPSNKHIYNDNFTLSSLRAGAVAKALIQFGVDPSRLSVRGMGSLKPLAPEYDANGKPLPDNMAKNRRVHIVIHTSHPRSHGGSTPTAH